MTKANNLADKYAIACGLIQKYSTELYEAIHDDDGEPIDDVSEIQTSVAIFRRSVNIELDLIKSSLEEYLESK
tara:strand:- start:3847 stop:4065 length:219 start_codon:yes stop_codon:yes gene_type:complete